MINHSPDRLLPGAAVSPSATPAPMQSSEISFRQIFAVLRRRYRLVALLAIVGGSIGAFLASREPATYQATAVLRVADERRALTNGVEAPQPEVGREIDPILSLVQLVQSRSTLGSVVDSVGLQLRSATPKFFTSDLSQIRVDSTVSADSVVLEFAPDRVTAQYGTRRVTGAYGQLLPLGPVQFAVDRAPSMPRAVLELSNREVAIDWLRGGLAVAPRPETNLIDVSFVSDDPRLAQQIVNRTVENYRQLNIVQAKDKSRRRRQVLAEQLAQADSVLARAQAQLASFRSRQQLASSGSKLAAEQTNLIQLEDTKTRLETDRSTYGTLYKQLSTGGDRERAEALQALAGSPALGDNPQVTGLYQRLNALQMALDSMTTGPWAAAATNPDVLKVRERIKFTQDELTKAVSAHLGTLNAKIATLGDLGRRGGQSIELLPALQAEEEQLSERVSSLGRVSDQTRQDFQRARLAEEVEAGDVEIVDRAGVPYQSLWTIASIKLGIGLILGLFLGCGLAFVLEAMNTSIRRPEDIEAMLHVPGLAVIPRLEAGGSPARSRGLAKSSKTALPRSTAATEMQPFSVGTEAFRMLRTSLVWSEGGEQLRTLVVTSAAPGEGKTLTSANLAVSFANDGLRVLLVDCDVRRPRMHGLFRVPRSPGLLDVLAPSNGRTDGTVRSLSLDAADGGGDALEHVLRPTPVRGLTLLPCGALPTNASSLLSGVRMRTLLVDLNERFDLVILDTPPVLATADAGILGSLADGVLLVVRAGQTDRAAAQRAYQQLVQAGSRVLGAVLNDPKGELSQYGEYYYPYEYVAEKE